ncbi:sugar ABC transporter substrate-binding protein [Marinomonas posidonica]|uniref:Periplasmic binding protein/LacI transcriptional regulator n=1 Tax=Marinomonas posidonica (strain CECT 7376 / NCIMB 14433 / IVIA-Po-181) TaxID=491952 RepID=F6CTS6_MARPP|nr:sugar ABC transporter substrate-binding protein [Marinomonas posidonica]AEF56295.1 periplasmic binding protein/LacI transcriptional regulator [Marinomonas posidonica IVIA-Po-181]
MTFMKQFSAKKLACLIAATSLSTVAVAETPIIGLITKTNTNPFFVKMKEGAQAKAKELGVELRTFAGRYDGDNETQVQAVENLISAGAKGILITPSDTSGIVPAIQKARDAGLLVIALDTPLSPANAADMTFATDNFKAGEMIGMWAKAKMGDKAKDAKIALLDLNSSQITVDVARDQGFLKGFGIDVKDPRRNGDETDSRIVGNDVTQGSEEGGRRAMENLLQKDPEVNLVYTINEPAAAGAYEALKSFGLEKDVLIVSVDGGCPGVQNIGDGVIGATSMQFPLKMASEGVTAIVDFAKSGSRPSASDGLDFFDTGVQLITDEPVEGVQSISSETGLSMCWG